MWPLGRKRYPPKAQLQLQEAWSFAQGEYRGKPLITRCNTGLTEIAGHPEYAHQVGVAVPLKHPTPQGLPTREEAVELDAIEDLLAQSLQENNQSLFAAVLSTGGMREFVFYTSDQEYVKWKFEEIRQSIHTHQIQLMIQSDPTWSVYKQLLG